MQLTRLLLRRIQLIRLLLRWIWLPRRLLRWITTLTRRLLGQVWLAGRLLRRIWLGRITGRRLLRRTSVVGRSSPHRCRLLLTQRQPENARQQHDAADNQADDRGRPQDVCDRAQITRAGQADYQHLAPVACA